MEVDVDTDELISLLKSEGYLVFQEDKECIAFLEGEGYHVFEKGESIKDYAENDLGLIDPVDILDAIPKKIIDVYLKAIRVGDEVDLDWINGDLQASVLELIDSKTIEEYMIKRGKIKRRGELPKPPIR